jgi:hypothetical protein
MSDVMAKFRHALLSGIAAGGFEAAYSIVCVDREVPHV